MIDEFTKRDIENISYNILKQSKSLDVFPTPVDKILEYSNFALDNSIDLTNIHQSFFENLKEKSQKSLLSAISKIKGIFDRNEKTIYIDSNLDKYVGKKNFVKLHEIGHGVLTWQNDFTLTFDNDETLTEEYDEQFEAEANYFASITLFQHDRFIEDMAKSNLGIGTVMQLSKKYGASVHSAFRNYVLKSKNRCALLILNPNINLNGKISQLSKRNLFYSESFLNEIGELDLPDEFGFKWSFVQDFQFKKKFNDKGIINFTTKEREELRAGYHFFNNTYNSFVFIFPKGEKNNAKTKIIMQ